MKKKIIIPIVIVIALALVLFFPIKQVTYDDGGTREYAALTYKIIKWNRYVSVYNEDGDMERVDKYTETSVYWLPDNFKSIDELWKMEYHAD